MYVCSSYGVERVKSEMCMCTCVVVMVLNGLRVRCVSV